MGTISTTAALRWAAIVTNSERYVVMSYYVARSLSLTNHYRSAAQRSRSENRPLGCFQRIQNVGVSANAVITMRFDYDTTTIRLRRIARDSTRTKKFIFNMNTSMVQALYRSRRVVGSNITRSYFFIFSQWPAAETCSRVWGTGRCRR